MYKKIVNCCFLGLIFLKILKVYFHKFYDLQSLFSSQENSTPQPGQHHYHAQCTVTLFRRFSFFNSIVSL